jgi:RHS repeat-associated protein
VKERDGNNNPTVAYTRGLDLSGTLEGLPRERFCEESGTGAAASDWSAWSAGAVFALSRGEGGIGGMLARSSGYSGGSWGTHDYYYTDGRGDITRVVNTTLSSVANYQFDPYGRMFSGSDSIANVYRFSSKRQHINSGMYYFGNRFYVPWQQRWLNRDPMLEVGFALVGGLHARYRGGEGNVYDFVGNDPVGRFDSMGLYWHPFGADWEFQQFSLCVAAQAQYAALVDQITEQTVFGGGADPTTEAELIGVQAMMDAFCGPPPGPPPEPLCPVEPPRHPEGPPPPGETVVRAAKWATIGTALYWIISEGSRFVFPPRNLAPVP